MSMGYIEDVAAIRKEASLYGAGVTVHTHIENQESQPVIIIDLIAVPVTMRRQGVASRILGEFTDVSDAWGVPLMLEASTDFGTPRLALHQLYTSAGFVLAGENNYKYYPQIVE